MIPTMIRETLRRRLRRLAADEGGIALPVALFAMISSMALAGAAVVATVDVQQGATRDGSSKRAIAAADAGANVARERQTRYGFVLNEKNPCLKVGTGGKLEKAAAERVGGASWCPAVSGTVGGDSYVYRVSPVGISCGSYELCVVSTGTADTVSRRIEVTYNRSGLTKNINETRHWEESKNIVQQEAEKIIAIKKGETEKVKKLEEEIQHLREELTKYASAEGFVGRDGIVLSGNADIRMGVGTNGTIESSGNASICGGIRHGIGKQWIHSGNASQCSGYKVTEGNVELPPVSSFMPTNIATVNSDYRLVKCTSTNNPVGCQSDTLTSEKGNGGGWTSTSPWNPATRTISLSANSTLTVGGGDYWVCAITFSGNSQLIMASGAHVRFFFDTPEHCNNNGNQLSFSGNNRISATGYQPSLGQFSMPGFFFLGSPNIATTISMSGNASVTNEMVVYAPESNINISGNATWKGVIVGKQINMSGNGHVEQDAGYELPPEINPITPIKEKLKVLEEIERIPVESMSEEQVRIEVQKIVQKWEEEETKRTNTAAVYFTPQSYFECTGTTPVGGTPNANC
jgi:hypothetical protein